MYDMCMCGGKDCPLKNDCYRFTGEVLGRQDFFGSAPYDLITQSCEHFYENSQQIAKLAYIIWEKNGKLNGKDKIDWEKAKKMILEGKYEYDFKS